MLEFHLSLKLFTKNVRVPDTRIHGSALEGERTAKTLGSTIGSRSHVNHSLARMPSGRKIER